MNELINNKKTSFKRGWVGGWMDGLLVRNFEEDSYEILLLDFDQLWNIVGQKSSSHFPFVEQKIWYYSSVFQIHKRKLGFAHKNVGNGRRSTCLTG
jgi:hypothetical protein